MNVQEIVNNHVYANIACLVDELLKTSSDFQELFYENINESCSYCEGEGESFDEDKDDFETCKNCSGEGYLTHDPLTYLIVSDWLAHKLYLNDEFLIKYAGLNVWGRSTYGQMITCDYVIQKIAKESL